MAESDVDEYRIFETDQFTKDLGRLARAGEQRLLEKLRRVVYPQLRRHPHMGSHVRRLKGYQPPTWRYRIGAWRFFYEIDEQDRSVFLLAAVHRGSAYDGQRGAAEPRVAFRPPLPEGSGFSCG